MTEEFDIPATIEAVVQDFEGRSTPFAEVEVHSALANARAALQEPVGEANLGAGIEIMSFGLSPGRNGPSPWGTYFNPLGSETYEDGTVRYFPDINEAPPSTLAHWEERVCMLTWSAYGPPHNPAWMLSPSIRAAGEKIEVRCRGRDAPSDASPVPFGAKEQAAGCLK
ncbi:MAG: hypothetical protein RO009_01680 [Pseudorhodoplanes sp.]|jgi:hypothetical protein|nr:hypothetical protein [Pseudorhodoplanes sp.]